MPTKKFPYAERKDYWSVDARHLRIDPDFIERETYEDIDVLVKWIKANGIQNLNPLKCYKKGDLYFIRRGSRRFKAIQILMAATKQPIMVPVISVSQDDNIERQYFEQATENDSVPYSPWEKAKVLRKARNEYGWSEEKMAEESGWSDVYIRDLLSLADAPEKLIQLVRSGKISGTFAIEKIKQAKAEEDPKILQELIEKGESLKEKEIEPELFPDEQRPVKPRRLTAGDLPKPASVKKVKKWASTVDAASLSPEKKEAFEVWQLWFEGKLTEEYFIDYLTR